MNKRILFTSILLSTLSVFAANVPEFRGEGRTGIYNETGLAKKWAKEGPALLWKNDKAGEGYLPPSVVDGKLYLNALDSAKKNETLKVLDASTGNILWEVAYAPVSKGNYNCSRSMPTIVGDYAYLISASCIVSCVDLKEQKLLWTVDAANKYQGQSLPWGYAESPLVVDGKVICTTGGNMTSVVALDAKTGKEVWKSEAFKETASYLSPILIEHNGKKQIVAGIFSYLIGLDPETGKTIWEATLLGQGNDPYQRKRNSNDPTYWRIFTSLPIYKDGKILISGGYNAGAILIEVPEKGEAKVLWKNPDFDNHLGGIVLLDGVVYGSNWESNQKGNWMGVDFETGKTFFNQEWKGFSKGSIVSADGMLYVYEEKKGEVALVKPSKEKFDVQSSFGIKDGRGSHWAHIVIADKVMYIKRGEVLFAYDIKE